MKRIIKWLQLWESVWVLPVVFYLVLYVSSLLVRAWGNDVGVFPPGLVNAGLIAALILLIGTGLANFILYFYHRGIWRYYYNKNDHSPINVKFDFQFLPIWLRFLYLPFLILSYLFLYCMLVVQLI